MTTTRQYRAPHLKLKPRPRAHPLAAFIYDETQRQGRTLREVADKTGREYTNIVKMGGRKAPTVDVLSDCLRALGYRLLPVPVELAPSNVRLERVVQRLRAQQQNAA
ncbi:MAG: hypothetical protein AB7E79_05115 [Rhodospirillaceae bacterium]